MKWLLCFLFYNIQAFCFPEMIRFGYQSCMSCHYSPTGGGAITPYGRSQSKEILSRNGFESEENLFYKIENKERNWDISGNFRFLQIYLNNEFKEKAEIFPMQMDVEPVVNLKNFTAVMSAGITKEDRESKDIDFISRRYFLKYQALDQLSLRVGRFYPQFGILIPDHNRLSRKKLSFDNGSETLNLESVYLGEKWEFFYTKIFDQYKNNSRLSKNGGAASVAHNFKNSKVGLSIMEINKFISQSLWGTFGLSEQMFLLTEFDKLGNELISTNIFGYETTKGIITYVGYESSLKDKIKLLGVQYFPRPHLEFKLECQDQGYKSYFAYLMLSFYL